MSCIEYYSVSLIHRTSNAHRAEVELVIRSVVTDCSFGAFWVLNLGLPT